MKTRLSGIMVLSLALLCRCSFQPQAPRLLVRLETRSPSFRPASSMHCFALTASGYGIVAAHSKRELGGIPPEVLNVGAASILVSPQDVQTQGATLSILSGPARRIVLWGIRMTDGTTSCPVGSSLPTLFGTYYPAVYKAAETTLDLFQSQTISLTYDESGESNEILEAHYPPDPPPAQDNITLTRGTLAYLGDSGEAGAAVVSFTDALASTLPPPNVSSGLMTAITTQFAPSYTASVKTASYHARIDILYRLLGIHPLRFRTMVYDIPSSAGGTSSMNGGNCDVAVGLQTFGAYRYGYSQSGVTPPWNERPAPQGFQGEATDSFPSELKYVTVEGGQRYFHVTIRSIAVTPTGCSLLTLYGNPTLTFEK